MSVGRGSWIRTNDLQYPKLPRYQAALYPDCLEYGCRYTLGPAAARRAKGADERADTLLARKFIAKIGKSPASLGMIRKSLKRFSEKIMPIKKLKRDGIAL